MILSADSASPLLEQLTQALEKYKVRIDELPPIVRERLQALVLYSPRLATICISKPDRLIPWLQEDSLQGPHRFQDMKAILQTHFDQEEDKETAIRKFHRSELIRIAWRDLCNLDEIEVITEEISDLADTVVQASLDLVWERTIGQYGIPFNEEERRVSRMCVVALGKLGGRELNFSSDIDLMFIYDSSGETEGTFGASVSNETFYTQLAQGLCDFWNKVTPDGFLYRVDTRLRPEGDRGALAVPLSAVELYYHNYGQNWERQALLKARVLAGDENVGKEFMSIITPFTYRKYVDEVEIAEVLRSIDRMRTKYLNRLETQEARDRDFKNGYGGIRDIEFFVQAVQMLYGGQYPEIKLAGTLLSLKRMHESHLLHSKDFGVMAYAYRFLRKIEHRMQMVGDRQVYELPNDPESQELLAKSLDYPSYNDLKKQYDELRHEVRKIYDGVFKRDEWHDVSEVILDTENYDSTVENLLKEYEFADPEKAYRFLRDLCHSPDVHLQPKTTRLFKAILPRLLLCLKKSPDSDLALTHFEQLVSRFKARTALYETLQDQPPLLELLVSVVSSSNFLTRLVMRDTSLMETIGRDGVFDEIVSKESLKRHLEIIQKTYPKKDRREHLLFVQNAAMFLSGMRFILGLTDVESMGHELAHIADFVLEQSLVPVNELLRSRFGDLVDDYASRLALLGYGKLGGQDFNIASDCDVVVVYYEGKEGLPYTSGEFFQRWVTEFTRFMESKTFMGYLYHIDTRLRPHGKSGALALGMQTFRDYYLHQAQFWEKMALTRARFICGHPEVENELSEIKNEVLFQRPCNKEEIEHILEMRKRIESEKRKEELKAGPGGLVDVEFIAQALVLTYGHAHEALRDASTFQVLRYAEEQDWLPRDDASQLIASYRFLRDVENRLRVVNNVSLDSIPHDPEELEKLTKRYALKMDAEKPTPEGFLEMISFHTQRVREIFYRFFEYLKSQAI